MKELLRYSGLIVLLFGVILLVVTFLNTSINNTNLILSALLVGIGFLGYIFTNRYME